MLRRSGQSAIEAMMAVFAILGIFLVISLISAQRGELNRQIAEFDQDAAICDRISFLIGQADSFVANTTVRFYLDRPLTIDEGSISFGPSGHYCYFSGTIASDPAGKGPGNAMVLTPGYYVLKKENGVITIAAASAPS